MRLQPRPKSSIELWTVSETISTLPQVILLKIKFYCHVQVPVPKDPHPQFLRMKECPNVYILYQQGTKIEMIEMTSLYLVSSLVTLFALIKVSQKDPTYPSRPKKPDLFRVRSDTSTPESKGGVQSPSPLWDHYSITGTSFV